MEISLTQLEQAINYWRTRRPSRGEEKSLSPEVDALATIYALMIYEKARSLSLTGLEPDTRRLIEGWLENQGR